MPFPAIDLLVSINTFTVYKVRLWLNKAVFNLKKNSKVELGNRPGVAKLKFNMISKF